MAPSVIEYNFSFYAPTQNKFSWRFPRGFSWCKFPAMPVSSLVEHVPTVLIVLACVGTPLIFAVHSVTHPPQSSRLRRGNTQHKSSENLFATSFGDNNLQLACSIRYSRPTLTTVVRSPEMLIHRQCSSIGYSTDTQT